MVMRQDQIARWLGVSQQKRAKTKFFWIRAIAIKFFSMNRLDNLINILASDIQLRLFNKK